MLPRVTLRLAAAIGAVAAYHLAVPTVALAYIDPISGSIIIQVVIAAVLASMLGIKRVWWSITGFFRRLFRRPPP